MKDRVTPSDEAPALPGDTGTPLAVTDALGRVVAWSADAARLTGLGAGDAVGRPVADLLDTHPHWRTSGADEWRGTLGVRRPEGRRRRMRGRAYCLLGGAAEGPLWLLVQEPGTVSRAEQVSPTAEALADWVLTGSPVAVAVYDTGMRCVRQNEAMRRLTGVPDEERIGQGLSAAVTGADVGEWEARMRRVLDTGRAEEGFLLSGRTVRDPDHDRRFTVSASPLRDRAGHVVGVCATVIDSTEQYRARERLALLNEASTRVGSTLDVMRTGQELTDLVVPRLADFVCVDLVEALLTGEEPPPGPVHGVVLRRVAHRSVREGTPEAVVRVGEVDWYTANSAQARCLATGRSALYRTMREAISWIAEDPARLAKVKEYGIHSWMIVPVRARGTTLGVAMFLRSRRGEPFEAEDLSLAEELVARAAVCLDNARRFTREHMAALTLQRSLLPQRLPEQSAVHAAFRYLPGAPELGVGGDWFDVIPLSGARVALVVGDVVGHGLQASATMGRLRTAVRTLADVDLAPAELLTRLDDLVIRLATESETGAEGIAPGDTGATCLYAVYDPVAGHCCLARAGHPLPAVVWPDGTAELLELPGGPPLGLGGLPFESIDVELPAGSLLALYTDGLIESRQRDAATGVHRLLRELTGGSGSPDALCDRVSRALFPDHPADDAALLLARVQRLDVDRVATWDVPAEPEAVSVARARAVGQMREWGLETAGYVTELVVSELVTNAVRHGGTPIELRLIRDRSLICEVFDGSSTAPHLRRARVFDEGGRGLMLVAQLTQRWGTRQTPGGKLIWCEQPLP
ncbi:SpoIIE family protein phosphatase [Streptomyces sp. 5-6(2022)]|uniref:ATP-binding SpoIIE family protein phosphatase n=1 Tax=Streptomyces sp. 5-6(2022) TaxID=2936510 RepID=UPI0023B970C3|nr:SpoIIE family protein phosphatase [Streptomyces sp. 5-6(2022)]